MACGAALALGHHRADTQHACAVDVADEFFDIGIARVQQDVLWLALLDNETVLQDHQMIGKFQRLIKIVGDEDDGLVKILLQLQKQVLHGCADQRVEGREGLVHQHDISIRCQRPRQTDTLLHPARQLVRIGILISFKSNPCDPAARLVLRRRQFFAADLRGKKGVVQNRAVWQQGEFLEHHRHLCLPQLAQLCGVISHDVIAIHHDLAGGRLDQPVQMPDQG